MIAGVPAKQIKVIDSFIEEFDEKKDKDTIFFIY